jgi:hypothetical protein
MLIDSGEKLDQKSQTSGGHSENSAADSHIQNVILTRGEQEAVGFSIFMH